MANFKNKISNLVNSQVPEFVLQDHPKFVEFLKTYYIFMESALLEVTSVETTDGIQLESQTGQTNLLLLNGTGISSDITISNDGDKIILESSAFGKFTRGEIVVGQTSKATSTILAEDLNNNRLFITSQDKFITGETILGQSSNASAVVNNYKPNPVSSIQDLLNFRDPDKVIDNFFSHFKYEFLSTIPDELHSTIDKRSLVKNIKYFYGLKGTKEGHNLLFRALFNERAETIYPREQLLRVSDGKWNTNKILKTINSLSDNVDTHDLIGRTITGSVSGATAIVENVFVSIVNDISISEFVLNVESISGTFLIDEEIYGTKTDEDDILLMSTVTGIPTSFVITDGGSLYNSQQSVKILGGGTDCIIQTKTISSGKISNVIIDNPGLGYSIGDELIFDNTNTNGGGAAGFVKIVNGGLLTEDEDRIVLEDYTTTGDPYTGNVIVQEIGTGVSEITDVYLYNRGSNYTSLPTVTVKSNTGTNSILKLWSDSIGKIIDLKIVEPGIEYQNLPSPTLTFYENLILTNLTSAFVIGENVSNNSTLATVVSFDSDTGLLILKDATGSFTFNSTISGNLSGASGTIRKIAQATADVVVGSVLDMDGSYINQDGLLDEQTMKIQDSLYYQDFSYVIKVGRSIKEWREDFKRTVHTAGFYFTGQVDISSKLNVKVKTPIIGQISEVVKDPIFLILNTLFTTVFGRRLGTVDDGTTLRTNPSLGSGEDFDTSTLSPFSNTTRDVTLYRQGLKIDYLSRKRENVGDVTIVKGFVYAGPRYETINREIFRTFAKTTDTNYSIAELSKNVTFGTNTSYDGQDNTLYFCSSPITRGIKTKLTMPAEITITS